MSLLYQPTTQHKFLRVLQSVLTRDSGRLRKNVRLQYFTAVGASAIKALDVIQDLQSSINKLREFISDFQIAHKLLDKTPGQFVTDLSWLLRIAISRLPLSKHHSIEAFGKLVIALGEWDDLLAKRGSEVLEKGSKSGSFKAELEELQKAPGIPDSIKTLYFPKSIAILKALVSANSA